MLGFMGNIVADLVLVMAVPAVVAGRVFTVWLCRKL
jgi:hypothetical protein